MSVIPLWFADYEPDWPAQWFNWAPSAPGGSQGDDTCAIWEQVASPHTAILSGDTVEAIRGTRIMRGQKICENADFAHRGYPILDTIEQAIPFQGQAQATRVYVWADVDLSGLDNPWLSLDGHSTTGNPLNWLPFGANTVGPNRYLEYGSLPHTRLADVPFPNRQWVRITTYIDFTGNGYVATWMDGVKILESTNPGDRVIGHLKKVTAAHWGLYCSHVTPFCEVYNDYQQLWGYEEPLVNIIDEPVSPFEAITLRASNVAGQDDSNAFNIVITEPPTSGLLPRPDDTIGVQHLDGDTWASGGITLASPLSVGQGEGLGEIEILFGCTPHTTGSNPFAIWDHGVSADRGLSLRPNDNVIRMLASVSPGPLDFAFPSLDAEVRIEVRVLINITDISGNGTCTIRVFINDVESTTGQQVWTRVDQLFAERFMTRAGNFRQASGTLHHFQVQYADDRMSRYFIDEGAGSTISVEAGDTGPVGTINGIENTNWAWTS